MYELDSYYNYRLTNNYLDHGYLGDVIIDGREWDMHSYAPSGVPLDYPPLLIYLTAFIYKLINLFASIPLLVVCFWLSAFIAPLAGVVAYLLTRRLTNEKGAVVAGILTTLAPFYFIRTVPGWFDTDIFIILFPILVVWILWEASINKNPKKVYYYRLLPAWACSYFHWPGMDGNTTFI
jgi:dolichyl-diphosphooligosaccharide--protein glycosyltransferase